MPFTFFFFFPGIALIIRALLIKRDVGNGIGCNELVGGFLGVEEKAVLVLVIIWRSWVSSYGGRDRSGGSLDNRVYLPYL